MRVELEREENRSQVFKVMPPDYYQKFKVITAESLSEVERELKKDDFLQVLCGGGCRRALCPVGPGVVWPGVGSPPTAVADRRR